MQEIALAMERYKQDPNFAHLGSPLRKCSPGRPAMRINAERACAQRPLASAGLCDCFLRPPRAAVNDHKQIFHLNRRSLHSFPDREAKCLGFRIHWRNRNDSI
jgi:hypothetical protein